VISIANHTETLVRINFKLPKLTKDMCILTLYVKKNFHGDSCMFSVDKGEFKHYEYKTSCLKGKVFNSIKIVGEFCRAEVGRFFFKLAEKLEVWGPTSVGHIVLYDTSPEVMLVKYDKFTEDYMNKRKEYYRCSPHDVDAAKNLVDKTDNRIGETIVNNMKIDYSYGIESNSELKGTWCCQDENVVITARFYHKNDAEGACEGLKRTESFKIRGKNINYVIHKRICTYADIVAHLSNYHMKLDEFCFAKYVDSPGFVMATNGFLTFMVNTSKVCCCDKDCLPLHYLCHKNEDCCTENCYKGICYDPNAGDFDFSMDEFEERLPTWMRYVVLVSSLYVFAWCLRCCCPERRLPSDSMRMHDE